MQFLISHPTIIPFFSALTGAIIGGIMTVIAQIISHHYSALRENQKHLRENFQSVFPKIYKDVLISMAQFELVKPEVKIFRSNKNICEKLNIVKNAAVIIQTIEKDSAHIDPAILYLYAKFEFTNEAASGNPELEKKLTDFNFNDVMNKQIILSLLIYLYKIHKKSDIINSDFNKQLKQLVRFYLWELTKEDFRLPSKYKVTSLLQFIKWRIKL